MENRFSISLKIRRLALDAVFVVMGSKLPASLINAVFASIAAPLLHTAVRPVLRKARVIE